MRKSLYLIFSSNLFPYFFGGMVAIILLLLYSSSLLYLIYLTFTCQRSPNGTCQLNTLNLDGVINVLTGVGGLVSALVVAHLALAKPGEAPVNRFVPSGLPKETQALADIVANIYLLVWTLVGLAAVVVGVLLEYKMVRPLTDAGITWLGISVAASYSYFGIRPPEADAAQADASRQEGMVSQPSGPAA